MELHRFQALFPAIRLTKGNRILDELCDGFATILERL